MPPRRLQADPWTVGWGHTGSDVREGTKITQVVADQWLEADLAEAAQIVLDYVTVALNDNQFAALVSFVYNIGPGCKGRKDGFVWLTSGKPSSILRALNRGDYKGAALEFPKWNKAGGNVLKGLTRRRLAEQALFRYSDIIHR